MCHLKVKTTQRTQEVHKMQTQRKTSGWKQALVVGATLLSALTGTKANDSFNGDIGVLANRNNRDSYAEANVFYKLPGEVKGYTFMDLYNDGSSGYFGKTELTKSIGKNLALRTQVVHGNEFATEAGLGLKLTVPGLPKSTFATVYAMPLWANSNGREGNECKVGYFISQDLPANFYASSYGEANVSAANGATWGYGEIELGKKFGNWKVGLDVALNSAGDGKLAPALEARGVARYNF